MRTLSLIILLIASLSTTILAQDCNNPLLGIYRLQGLDSPQSGADLPYCNDLKSGETCCSADTVSSFQRRLNGLIDKLNNYDAARDLYIAQLRSEVFDRYQNLLEDVNDNIGSLQTIRQANANLADQLQSDIDIFTQVSNDANGINTQFTAAMDEFQAARNTCFTAALQVQASSWCLACDPNYATQGVAPDGSVIFSDGLCEAISEACWPYFNQSARFNPLIRVRQAYWTLATVAGYLNNVSSTGQVGDFRIPPDPYNPLSTQRDVTVPEEWIAGAEETSTTEQCQNLWADDQLLAELVGIGNPMSPESMQEEEVIIADEEASVEPAPQVIIVDTRGARLLQDALGGVFGVWGPNLDATGLDFSDLLEDPGDLFSDITDLTDQ